MSFPTRMSNVSRVAGRSFLTRPYAVAKTTSVVAGNRTGTARGARGGGLFHTDDGALGARGRIAAGIDRPRDARYRRLDRSPLPGNPFIQPTAAAELVDRGGRRRPRGRGPRSPA